jgi:glucose-6-phosphate isomerase
MTMRNVNSKIRFTVGYPDETKFAATVQHFVDTKLASQLASRDHTLWGQAAEPEAQKRLDWVTALDEAEPIVAAVTELRSRFVSQGITRVVLCGMGGSSLAPEVICASQDVSLVVLDSTQPDFVATALIDLEHTVVVVASKSGGTVETDSQRRIFESAFLERGIAPQERIVVVTDPGSPLSLAATNAGLTVFHANPNVGGRYSALTAFGLVPSGLAGANLEILLGEAREAQTELTEDSPENPALKLAALIADAHQSGIDKLVLADAHSDHPGFADWVEQLVAESTGKEGKGSLPVVVEGIDAPNFAQSTNDSLLVAHGSHSPFGHLSPASHISAHIEASVGGSFLLWEYAVALASVIIGVNPFDQPDVESAKSAAREMLEGSPTPPEPQLTVGNIALYGGLWLNGASDLGQAITALLGQLDETRGYLAIQAYLDRHRDAPLASLRTTFAQVTRRPVTFGWGPRFLHSTGQYHKGGPMTGVFLQITAEPEQDLPVPGRSFSCQSFLMAQAIGDGQVLAEHGRPVLRVHLNSVADIEDFGNWRP